MIMMMMMKPSISAGQYPLHTYIKHTYINVYIYIKYVYYIYYIYLTSVSDPDSHYFAKFFITLSFLGLKLKWNIVTIIQKTLDII